MKTTADVVVIGGGVVGASIALEVARHRLGEVLVLDKAPGPGEGSTGASSSICRTRYSHPSVVRLAVDGLRAFREWQEYLGVSAPLARFVESGALWIAARSAGDVEAEVDRLRGCGASAEAVTAASVLDSYPSLSTCVVPLDWESDHECVSGSAFLFEDQAGYIDPVDALADLLQAGTAAGARIMFGTEVVGVNATGGRVIGVRTAAGDDIAAGLVVNASGPWCNRLNAMAGVEHRWTFTPTRIQTLYRPWTEAEIPITLDVAAGVYARPERASGMVWVGSVREEDEREAVDDPDEFARSPSSAFREVTLASFQHRFPAAVAKGTVTGIAGLYTINRQDVHPVVGPSGVDGFWMANGFSGHGFKLAPMIGSMVASALGGARCGFDTDISIDLFAVDRQPIGVDAKNVLA